MKFLFALATLLLVSYVSCDCDQIDGTVWQCTGGSGNYPIQNFAFDDDDFSLYLQYSDCTVFQDGNYEIDNNDITVNLNGFTDNCETSEDNNSCVCFDDFEMQIDAQCLNIVGPNGEICVPQGDCAAQACSNGATPIADPNYVPSTNECGPSSIPFGAPSFAFSDCCNAHDICYPVCGKDKRDCDYEFYECMACACEDEYDTNVGEELCLIIACLYFQAVDEFGCGAYEDSQDNGCICPSNKAMEIAAPREYKPVSDKFGPHHIHELVDLYQKGTLGISDFFCDAPFEASCNDNTPAATNSNNSPATNSNNNSPASNSNNNSTASNSNNNSPASNSNNSGSSALVASVLFAVFVSLVALV